MTEIRKQEIKQQKNLPVCPLCQKGFFGCLVMVGEDKKSYHLECLKKEKEKEVMTLKNKESKTTRI